MSSTVYGYVRVSTQCQNEDRQMIAMEEMDVPEENVYVDKQSGKDFNEIDKEPDNRVRLFHFYILQSGEYS